MPMMAATCTYESSHSTSSLVPLMTVYDPLRETQPEAGLAVDASRRAISGAVEPREVDEAPHPMVTKKRFRCGILRSQSHFTVNPQPSEFVFPGAYRSQSANADVQMRQHLRIGSGFVDCSSLVVSSA
jgi:hypothetical protein